MLAYVDEAGDMGTQGRGSRWLVFGCAIFRESEKRDARFLVEAASLIAGKDIPGALHFKDLSHDDRMGVIDILIQGTWTGIIIASDTTKVRKYSILADPIYHYNYVARYVIERVSSLAEEANEEATICFEHRRGFPFSRLTGYIQLLLDRNTPYLNPNHISVDRIKQTPKGADSLLCIADGLAHAGFRALEPDRKWTRHERAYLEAFLPRIWKGPPDDENIHRRGLVLMPTPQWSSFVGEYPWLRTLSGK